MGGDIVLSGDFSALRFQLRRRRTACSFAYIDHVMGVGRGNRPQQIRNRAETEARN